MESIGGWSWLLANWLVLGEFTENQARQLLKKALDEGVNFFDTSDIYGDEFLCVTIN